jgi:DNA-binding NtrC family response regulator
MEIGAFGFFEKPYDPEEPLAKIEEAVGNPKHESSNRQAG